MNFGHRSRSLLFLGVVWLGIGFRLLLDPRPAPLPLEFLPLGVRVGLWWAGAVIAIAASFRRPPAATLGFVALSVPCAFRAASYFGTAVAVDSKFWLEAIIWVFVTAYVVNASTAPPDAPLRSSSA